MLNEIDEKDDDYGKEREPAYVVLERKSNALAEKRKAAETEIERALESDDQERLEIAYDAANRIGFAYLYDTRVRKRTSEFEEKLKSSFVNSIVGVFEKTIKGFYEALVLNDVERLELPSSHGSPVRQHDVSSAPGAVLHDDDTRVDSTLKNRIDALSRHVQILKTAKNVNPSVLKRAKIILATMRTEVEFAERDTGSDILFEEASRVENDQKERKKSRCVARLEDIVTRSDSTRAISDLQIDLLDATHAFSFGKASEADRVLWSRSFEIVRSMFVAEAVAKATMYVKERRRARSDLVAILRSTDVAALRGALESAKARGTDAAGSTLVKHVERRYRDLCDVNLRRRTCRKHLENALEVFVLRRSAATQEHIRSLKDVIRKAIAAKVDPSFIVRAKEEVRMGMLYVEVNASTSDKAVRDAELAADRMDAVVRAQHVAKIAAKMADGAAKRALRDAETVYLKQVWTNARQQKKRKNDGVEKSASGEKVADTDDRDDENGGRERDVTNLASNPFVIRRVHRRSLVGKTYRLHTWRMRLVLRFEQMRLMCFSKMHRELLENHLRGAMVAEVSKHIKSAGSDMMSVDVNVAVVSASGLRASPLAVQVIVYPNIVNDSHIITALKAWGFFCESHDEHALRRCMRNFHRKFGKAIGLPLRSGVQSVSIEPIPLRLKTGSVQDLRNIKRALSSAIVVTEPEDKPVPIHKRLSISPFALSHGDTAIALRNAVTSHLHHEGVHDDDDDDADDDETARLPPPPPPLVGDGRFPTTVVTSDDDIDELPPGVTFENYDDAPELPPGLSSVAETFVDVDDNERKETDEESTPATNVEGEEEDSSEFSPPSLDRVPPGAPPSPTRAAAPPGTVRRATKTTINYVTGVISDKDEFVRGSNDVDLVHATDAPYMSTPSLSAFDPSKSLRSSVDLLIPRATRASMATKEPLRPTGSASTLDRLLAKETARKAAALQLTRGDDADDVGDGRVIGDFGEVRVYDKRRLFVPTLRKYRKPSFNSDESVLAWDGHWLARQGPAWVEAASVLVSGLRHRSFVHLPLMTDLNKRMLQNARRSVQYQSVKHFEDRFREARIALNTINDAFLCVEEGLAKDLSALPPSASTKFPIGHARWRVERLDAYNKELTVLLKTARGERFSRLRNITVDVPEAREKENDDKTDEDEDHAGFTKTHLDLLKQVKSETGEAGEEIDNAAKDDEVDPALSGIIMWDPRKNAPTGTGLGDLRRLVHEVRVATSAVHTNRDIQDKHDFEACVRQAKGTSDAAVTEDEAMHLTELDISVQEIRKRESQLAASRRAALQRHRRAAMRLKPLRISLDNIRSEIRAIRDTTLTFPLTRGGLAEILREMKSMSANAAYLRTADRPIHSATRSRIQDAVDTLTVEDGMRVRKNVILGPTEERRNQRYVTRPGSSAQISQRKMSSKTLSTRELENMIDKGTLPSSVRRAALSTSRFRETVRQVAAKTDICRKRLDHVKSKLARCQNVKRALVSRYNDRLRKRRAVLGIYMQAISRLRIQRRHRIRTTLSEDGATGSRRNAASRVQHGALGPAGAADISFRQKWRRLERSAGRKGRGAGNPTTKAVIRRWKASRGAPSSAGFEDHTGY